MKIPYWFLTLDEIPWQFLNVRKVADCIPKGGQIYKELRKKQPWISNKGTKWCRNSISNTLKSVRLEGNKMFMAIEQCLGSGHLCSCSHKEISSSGWCGIEHVHTLLLPTSKREICHPLGFWQVLNAFEQFCLTLGLLLLSSEKECERFNFTGPVSDFWQGNFALWKRFLLLNSK